MTALIKIKEILYVSQFIPYINKTYISITKDMYSINVESFGCIYPLVTFNTSEDNFLRTKFMS